MCSSDLLNSGYTTDATATSVPGGFTVTVDAQGQGENVSTKEVLLSTNVSPSTAVQETSVSLVKVVNQSTTETLYGFYISSSSSAPGKMQFESRQLSSDPFYMITNGTDSTSSFGYAFSPIITPSNVISGAPGISVSEIGRAHV